MCKRISIKQGRVSINQYTIKAKFTQTNRVRTVNIFSDSESRLPKILTTLGFVEPFDITLLPSDPPSEAQLKYARELGVRIPKNASLQDVSALLDRELKNDPSEPNPELMEYALNRSLAKSMLYGKKTLYNYIFHALKGADKTAFFVFCIYRYYSDDRKGNLDAHPEREKFYMIANELSSNQKFIDSMEKFSGDKLRYFGSLKIMQGDTNVATHTGGNTKAVAFNMALECLTREFGIKYTDKKSIQRNSQANNARATPPAEKTKSTYIAYSIVFWIIGCLIILISLASFTDSIIGATIFTLVGILFIYLGVRSMRLAKKL